MGLTSLAKLPWSAEQGWPELSRSRPSLVRLFARLVLPLLPPAMIYYAGTRYPEVFLAGAAAKDWGRVAVVFFLAEMQTVLAMGWLIRQVALTNGLTLDRHDAFLLAAIAPVPLWLASLGLLVPSLGFNALLSLAALVVSCGLIYHGIEGLCRTREDVTAAAIVQTVIGAGLAAWALLLVLVVML
ncbi:uncharacterized protein DUF1282 [Sulfuritortus calidifontis]|uniref:Uncharacterized protein DUF1282 n=1 Tax=Sulfuritortus calidifontis TaxID=1914471 RepID=A0A4R3JWQ6_9PROT|nr:YIP1 family protein [Sulfuritortus calidifontis]TCS72758.1 uncharacterized protein DUF1282 [Sulfuritortus calidifontis]